MITFIFSLVAIFAPTWEPLNLSLHKELLKKPIDYTKTLQILKEMKEHFPSRFEEMQLSTTEKLIISETEVSPYERIRRDLHVLKNESSDFETQLEMLNKLKHLDLKQFKHDGLDDWRKYILKKMELDWLSEEIWTLPRPCLQFDVLQKMKLLDDENSKDFETMEEKILQKESKAVEEEYERIKEVKWKKVGVPNSFCGAWRSMVNMFHYDDKFPKFYEQVEEYMISFKEFPNVRDHLDKLPMNRYDQCQRLQKKRKRKEEELNQRQKRQKLLPRLQELIWKIPVELELRVNWVDLCGDWDNEEAFLEDYKLVKQDLKTLFSRFDGEKWFDEIWHYVHDVIPELHEELSKRV